MVADAGDRYDYSGKEEQLAIPNTLREQVMDEGREEGREDALDDRVVDDQRHQNPAARARLSSPR